MPLFGPHIVLDNPAYIHPTAQPYGKITIGTQASIGCNAVIRSELFGVIVGPYTDVQDFAMIHIGARSGGFIGSHCSITHHVTIHGCRIGDNCLVGINATIMEGCEIGDNCIIGPHSLLKENTRIPANSIVTGVPGEVRRTQNSYVRNRLNAFLYHRNALAYAREECREWDGKAFPAAIAKEVESLEKELQSILRGD